MADDRISLTIPLTLATVFAGQAVGFAIWLVNLETRGEANKAAVRELTTRVAKAENQLTLADKRLDSIVGVMVEKGLVGQVPK